MFSDRFDKVLWAVFFLLVIASGATTAYSLRTGDNDTRNNDRNLERKIAERARTVYLVELYAPVTAAMTAGQLSKALLTLDEIQRSMPDESYGLVLKGVVLAKMDAVDAAISSFVAGVKRNGDYIDRNGSLSHRDVVAKLVESQLPLYTQRVTDDKDDTAAAMTKRNLHYLQSRLAGGCE